MAKAFTKADVEILLSTMNRQSLDFLEPMFPFAHFSRFNILIVNQTEETKLLSSGYPNIRVVNSFERGLSKSRNLLLENASKKIGLITDDDVVFMEGFDEKVANGYNFFPNAMVLTFKAHTFEGMPIRKYPEKPVANINALWRLGISSIEMALNIARVKESGVKFDVRFGLGSSFPLGEEPIFVNELHETGGQISHYPEVIVTHKAVIDSKNISLAENYRIRGACLKKIFKRQFIFWLGIQVIYNLKSGIVKPWQLFYALRYGLKGRKEFLATQKH